MSTATSVRLAHGVNVGRTRALGLLLDEVSYATRELWRSRLVLVFTFVLPLAWLLIIGAIAGNAVVAETGVPIMQFVTPAAALMGIMFAAYPPVARSLAEAREEGLLKRIEGTPLPTWMYLVGRMGGALMLSLASILAMFAVGFLLYDVQIVWRTMPATIVTLVVAIATFSALGLAVGSLAPTAASAQTFAVASAIAVSFLSGLFTLGSTPPDWMTSLGSYFPAIHVLNPLSTQFSPALTGSGWELGDLAVVAVWGAIGLAVATWGLRRQARTPQTKPAVMVEAETTAQAPRITTVTRVDGGPSTPIGLTIDQVSWSIKSSRRDMSWVLFALGMPIALYAFMTSMPGNNLVYPHGMSFAFFFACAMTVYGIGVTAFVDLPAAIATLRDRLVLKRLRGTPLSSAQFMVGRTSAAIILALLTAALVLATGIVFFGVTISPWGLPLALFVIVLGTFTLAACGYALVCLVPNARAGAVVGLAILLPLAFVSEIFILGSTPDWFATVGTIFPLRHFVHALAGSLNPDGVTLDWTDLAVMAIWLVAAAAFAVRRWRWEPSR